MVDRATLYAGEYFLAIVGMAMARNCLTEPAGARPRVDDIRAVIDHFDEFPQSLALRLRGFDVEPGYTQWAPIYDGPNPAIEIEEPVVHAILQDAPRGVALDAACGTGRHAAHLTTLGYHVIGVDTTEGMLDVARAKLPGADLRRGRLEALPLDDESVDLVTCALALTHVEDLEPVFREFARVLRPGGWIVTSDIHPFSTITGGLAVFPGEDPSEVRFVPNLLHLPSEYVDAFVAADLVVRRCVEPRHAESSIQRVPSFPVFPDATRQAFTGAPFLLVWVLEKP
jgi:SAM-dependent methyltransferase